MTRGGGDAPIWPKTPEEMLRVASALAELAGGRADVAARYFDFRDGDRQVKGWAPWKGRAVSKDYKPMPGEVVQAFKNFKQGGIEYRILNPLSPQNLVEHLRGRERLGVYVLDAEARAKFLAADFDDHKGMLETSAVWAEVRRFVEVCTAQAWRVHVERSKSGKGYHVWMFFDEPVEARKLRALGRWLFEEAQAIREGEDFGTFDRFFPAQSVLPPAGKGFGNLIGLPLCGAKEYAAGRTAWVDDEGRTIADAMGYTLGIVERGRNPADRVDEFMREWKIDPESAEAYDGPTRDPDAKLGTAEEFEEVRSRCGFIRWVPEPSSWDHVKEPLWFAWVSNCCRFDVEDWIHDVSRPHPHYDGVSTELKIQHARASSGPHKCATIQKRGFVGCPKGGCALPSGRPTRSPAGLAAWAKAEERPAPRRDRTVRVDPKAGPPLPEAPAEEVGEFRWRDAVPLDPATSMPWPPIYGGFGIDADGVHDHQNQYITLRPVWVDALTRNNLGQWGVSIKFFDFDWKLKTHAFPQGRLHEQGGVLARELGEYGLPIIAGKEKWVSRFLILQEHHIARRIRAAGRLGWFDSQDSKAVFILPAQILGRPTEEIVYQPDVPMHASDTLHAQGSLREWQEGVADLCRGNPVLMFAVMVGLAGPLLKLCQEQSGGFHLYGVTTAGKTTAAQVAASVWGCAADPQEGPEVTSIRKWYTTGNALESLAEVHNDTLLTLDEISEVDPNELGRIIYQLAGGLSKGRANAGGGLRAMRAWRLLFFSTGEKSVRQMLSQVGQDQKGGQRVRLPDIPADNTDDGSRAIVMDPHGKDPKDFIQDLKAACAASYGLAGPVFVAQLIAWAEALGTSVLSGQLREELRQIEGTIANKVEGGLPPEGRRVLRRFSLVALAGYRAAMANVLGWTVDEILLAVCHVANRWIADQGQERSELERALGHLRDQLIKHAARFRWFESSDKGPARDLLGFRVKDYYLVTESGMRELCGEHDMRSILRALKTQGYLWHDKDRLTKKSPRIEGYGNTRPNLYWVRVSFLGEEVGEETEEDRAAAPPAVSPETGRRALRDDEPVPF